MAVSEEKHFDAILVEYQEAGKRILSLATESYRALGFVAALAGTFTVANSVSRQYDSLVLLIPVVLGVGSLIQLRIIREILTLGGYRSYLSTKMRDYGVCEMRWETVAEEIIHKRRRVYLENSALFTILLLGFGAGARQSFGWMHHPWGWIRILLYTILLIYLAAAVAVALHYTVGVAGSAVSLLEAKDDVDKDDVGKDDEENPV